MVHSGIEQKVHGKWKCLRTGIVSRRCDHIIIARTFYTVPRSSSFFVFWGDGSTALRINRIIIVITFYGEESVTLSETTKKHFECCNVDNFPFLMISVKHNLCLNVLLYKIYNSFKQIKNVIFVETFTRMTA